MRRPYYPLLVDLRRPAKHIHEVAVNSTLVNAIELPLVAPDVRLTQRPGLRQGQLLELVPDIEKLVE